MTGGFEDFLTGEMQKQSVPVSIIACVPNPDPNKPGACDPAKSFYTMTGIVIPEGKSFSARSVFGLRVHFRQEVQAAVKLVRNSDCAVVWAGDSDRGEAKKVTEHIVNQMLKQRPNWIPSPINRQLTYKFNRDSLSTSAFRESASKTVLFRTRRSGSVASLNQ